MSLDKRALIAVLILCHLPTSAIEIDNSLILIYQKHPVQLEAL